MQCIQRSSMRVLMESATDYGKAWFSMTRQNTMMHQVLMENDTNNCAICHTSSQSSNAFVLHLLASVKMNDCNRMSSHLLSKSFLPISQKSFI